jgi:hypothetical protein
MFYGNWNADYHSESYTSSNIRGSHLQLKGQFLNNDDGVRLVDVATAKDLSCRQGDNISTSQHL